jgi:hypothetical protein
LRETIFSRLSDMSECDDYDRFVRRWGGLLPKFIILPS